LTASYFILQERWAASITAYPMTLVLISVYAQNNLPALSGKSLNFILIANDLYAPQKDIMTSRFL